MEPQSVNTDLRQANDVKDEPRLRRFGIIDLILITTAMALQFKLLSTLDKQFNLSRNVTGLFAYTAAFKVALTLPALYWIPLHLAQTGKLSRQPGHWLLASQLFVTIGGTLFTVAALLYSDTIHREHFHIGRFSVFVVCQIASGTLLVAATFTIRGIWRITTTLLAISLYALAIGGITQLILVSWTQTLPSWTWMFGTIARVTSGLAAFSAVAGTLVDVVKKVPRDWLHWIGVIVTLAWTVFIPLVNHLFVRFASLN